MMHGKRILITGAGGYLGSHMARKLSTQGAICFLLDRQFPATLRQIATEDSSVKLLQADITHMQEVQQACSEALPDLVFHFAARIDRNRDFSIFDELWKVNVLGTRNLLEALAGSQANQFPSSRFCYAGSSEVYGIRNQPPFSEEMIPDPVSPYSLTKLMAEELIRTWYKSMEDRFTIFRIFLFAGPAMPPTTFLGEIQQAILERQVFHMTPGEQRRDYLPLDDLLEGMVKLSEHPDAAGEIINLCSGSSISMKDLSERMVERSAGMLKVERDLPYRLNEIWEIRGSNEKLKRLVPEFPAGTLDNIL